jgi:hypothetical protein
VHLDDLAFTRSVFEDIGRTNASPSAERGVQNSSSSLRAAEDAMLKSGSFGALSGALLLVACGGHGAGVSTGSADTGNGNASADAAAGVLGSGVGEGDGGLPTACADDSDCNSGNPCLIGSCNVTTSGEVQQGTCVYASADSGACTSSTTGGPPPIDPTCSTLTCTGSYASVFPPAMPLLPADVPAACSNGFEVGDADKCSQTSYVLSAKSAGGAAAITLDVDLATYDEADGVTITGVDGAGQTYTLLETCRMQTWSLGDPTGGVSRPPDAAIRQFRLPVQAGTKSLTIDFSLVRSPMYMQVLGLCDFDVPSFSEAKWWTAVP